VSIVLVETQNDSASAATLPFTAFSVASVEVIAVADWVIGLLVVAIAVKFAVTVTSPVTSVSVLGLVVDVSLQFVKE
jgi:hypothetical protein